MRIVNLFYCLSRLRHPQVQQLIYLKNALARATKKVHGRHFKANPIFQLGRNPFHHFLASFHKSGWLRKFFQFKQSCIKSHRKELNFEEVFCLVAVSVIVIDQNEPQLVFFGCGEAIRESHSLRKRVKTDQFAGNALPVFLWKHR